MPLINEYKVKNKASFKKKSYRPWNIEGKKLTGIAPETEKDNKVNNIVDFSTSHSTELIEEQTENKKVTISTQTGLQNENLKYTNREQTKNISETLIKHIEDKEETNSTLFREPILSQSSHNQPGYLPLIEIKSDALRRLCGHQRKLLFYIVNQCVLRGQLSSGPITTEALAEVIGAHGMTVKTSIQRLIGKGFFVRDNGKVGRGGFSNFLISEALRNAVMEELQQLNFGKQIGNNWITKQETSPLCSSSNLNNTTTTDPVQNIELPEDWESINVEPLDFIKFNRNHLIQLFKTGKLTSEIVQNSIEAFAFDLEYNN
ncbi:MAG: hypothetical protein IBJ00_06230, partial [Alphaproteobacteria bacterium]|nr:hypothetical protein [Alphaproteobacteria bacterium]